MPTTRTTACTGFTLLEMMVVVALVAIFATMALPAYQARTMQSQVLEVQRFAEPVTRVVADFHAVQGRFPASNEEAGLPAPEKYIGTWLTRLEIENGAIHATLGNRVAEPLRGKKLTLRPAHVAGEPRVPVSWVCGMAKVPAGLTVQGTNRTDLPPLQLPLECRM